MFDKMGWQFFAVGSAFFAGLTAILAKVSVREINSNLATLIRTAVIVVLLGGGLVVAGAVLLAAP
jgi:transporter family protein